MNKKVCENCGSFFYSPQPNKKYCAPQCRWSYNDKHKKEKHRGITLPYVPERFIEKKKSHISGSSWDGENN